MPRFKKPPAHIVDPDAATPGSAQHLAERLLADAGWPECDTAWLAPLLLRRLSNGDAEAVELNDRLEANLSALASIWSLSGNGDRDAAMLLILAALTGCVRIPGLAPALDCNLGDELWTLPRTQWEPVVKEVQCHDVDFNLLLRRGWPEYLVQEWSRDFGPPENDHFRRFGDVLLSTNAIDLLQILDFDGVIAAGASGDWHPRSATINNSAIAWDDGVSWRSTRSLRTWLWYTGYAGLERTLPRFIAATPDQLPALATSVAEAVATAFGARSERHFAAFYEMEDDLRRPIAAYFAHLDHVLQTAGGSVAEALRAMWIVYFRMAWDSRVEDCPPDLKARALAIATEDLSRLRPLLAAARTEGETPEARQFSGMLPHLGQCVEVLARHGGIWRAMKPLLLAMRALGTPCVARDLRYWNEPALESAPHPWCIIPAQLVGVIHAYAGREQEADPELTTLRSALASHCLERLKDRKDERKALRESARVRTDADMIEPSHEWRYCLVRAVVDLRVNPEGRGHQTLYWSSLNDPDQHVKEAAQRAYETIRHARALPQHVSPRRMLMSAIWWLRQAHLLGLGVQPDSDRALRTREKELSRTKEVEHADGRAPRSA